MFFELPDYSHYISMIRYVSTDEQIEEWFFKLKSEHDKNIMMYMNDQEALEYFELEYKNVIRVYRKEYQGCSEKVRCTMAVLWLNEE